MTITKLQMMLVDLAILMGECYLDEDYVFTEGEIRELKALPELIRITLTKCEDSNEL